MIKKLTKNNLDELFELDNKIFKFDKYSKNQILEELSQEDRIYLGYFEGEKLVGFVGVQVVLETSDLLKIGVDKPYQRFGVATKLFLELKQTLKNLNVTTIMLEVREQNMPATNFYKKMGFRQISKRDKYYQTDNALIFKLDLIWK